MPEQERAVSHEPEEDGPWWDEGASLPSEAEMADLLDDGDED